MNYGKFVHRWHKLYGKLLIGFFVLWFAVVGGISACAVLDTNMHLGWGYQPKDAVIGPLMLLGGALAFVIMRLFHRFLGTLNTRFYGPDIKRDLGTGSSKLSSRTASQR